MPVNNYIRAEVFLDRFEQNLVNVRKRIASGGAKLCTVLKANAYGHGIAALWPVAAKNSDYLAVATIAEALDLRQMGYMGKLLVTMAAPPSAGAKILPQLPRLIADAIQADIELAANDIQCVSEIAELVKNTPSLQKFQAKLHLKIDTGMGRSGTLAEDADELVNFTLSKAQQVKIAGIFTHYANADSADKTHANSQSEFFTQLLGRIRDKIPAEAIIHASASAAIADFPKKDFDMVRLGLAAYGYQSEELENPLEVKPILRLTAPITQIKKLPQGKTCGYGCTHTLNRDSRVAIVPAGYADGINRLLSNKLQVKIDAENGQNNYAPVLGRVSMDQIIIDITDIPTAQIGSEAELISQNTQDLNSVANLAKLCQTIPYEITTSLNPWRTDFVYLRLNSQA